jgi:sigma-54 specific flagellar transcriptional regulator A
LHPEISVFTPQNIPSEVKPDLPREENSPAAAMVPEEIPDEGVSLNDVVRNVEKQMILKSLEKTSWNKQKAAKLLNLKRTTLIEKIKKYQDQAKE